MGRYAIKKPELLVPAGNFEKLRTAIHYGADAVYLGSDEFSLRARAGNFTLGEMEKAIEIAHKENVKVYVTVNIFARNEDVEKFPAYLNRLADIGPDAVIVSDPGMVRMVREQSPKIPVHLSTQSNTTNWASCEFWKEQGVERVGLARELSLGEIKEVRGKTDMDLEVFVHGAMCISYSGRCWMSKFMAERDANRGDCSQSCRWEYFLTESKRPGEYFPIDGDEKGTYLFNSKDLCLLDCLPDLIQAGVNTFKIEGRMKTAYYVGVVTNVYRTAIDRYWESPEDFIVSPQWGNELATVSYRGYTTAFLDGKFANDRLLHTFSPYRHYDFLGIIREAVAPDHVRVEVKNKFEIGDSVEFVGRGLCVRKMEMRSILDEEGNSLAVANPNSHVLIPDDKGGLEENSFIRKKIAQTQNKKQP